jgi:hypothetical protein
LNIIFLGAKENIFSQLEYLEGLAAKPLGSILLLLWLLTRFCWLVDRLR